MKKLILLSALIVNSFAVYANPVKLLDGTSAACESKFDVYNSKRTNVYTLSDLKQHNSTETTVSLSVKVTFLECKQTTTNQFSFSPKENHFTSEFETLSLDGIKSTITRIDTEKMILALNSSLKIIEQSEVSSDDSSSRVYFTFNKSELSQRVFSGLSSNKKTFIDLALRTKSDYYKNGKKEMSAPTTSGFFRVFINTKL